MSAAVNKLIAVLFISFFQLSACESGQLEELILPPKGFITTNKHWKTNLDDFQKATGYMKAAIDGDVSVIEELVKSGATPNEVTDHGFTPVMVSSTNNNIAALKLMLEAGANPDAQDYSMKWTPLMFAAQEGHIDATTVLLASNANPIILNRGGQYAHMIAEGQGHVRLGKILVDAGLKRALTDRSTDTVMAFIRDGADVNLENDQNWTPLLHVCALSADVSYVRELLDRGADSNHADPDGWTPLMFAALGGRVDMVQLLLEHGADCTVESHDGRVSPFMSSHPSVLGLLETFNAISHSSATQSVEAASERKRVGQQGRGRGMGSVGKQSSPEEEQRGGEGSSGSGVVADNVLHTPHIAEKMKYHKDWTIGFARHTETKGPAGDSSSDNNDPGNVKNSKRLLAGIAWVYVLPIVAVLGLLYYSQKTNQAQSDQLSSTDSRNGPINMENLTAVLMNDKSGMSYSDASGLQRSRTSSMSLSMNSQSIEEATEEGNSPCMVKPGRISRVSSASQDFPYSEFTHITTAPRGPTPSSRRGSWNAETTATGYASKQISHMVTVFEGTPLGEEMDLRKNKLGWSADADADDDNGDGNNDGYRDFDHGGGAGINYSEITSRGDDIAHQQGFSTRYNTASTSSHQQQLQLLLPSTQRKPTRGSFTDITGSTNCWGDNDDIESPPSGT